LTRRVARKGSRLPAKVAPSFRSASNFGHFVELLQGRLSASGAALDGTPVGFWHAFPVEEAIANGLFMVILDLARKEGSPVETSEDVAAISRRVDVLVDAGLSVGFANVESAAAAFVRRVVDPVHRAAALGFRPDNPPSMAAWKELFSGKVPAGPLPAAGARSTAPGDAGAFLGRPAALFFARVINFALRHKARLEERLAATERLNVLSGAISWIPDSELDFVRRAIRRIDGKGRRTAGAVEPRAAERPWGSWLAIASDLEAVRERIARTRRWPVRVGRDSGRTIRGSALEGWIATIALKAVGGIRSEEDVLTPPQFWKAISRYGEACRGAKGIRPVVARALKVLDARDPRLGEKLRAELSEALEAALSGMGDAYDDYEKMTAGMAEGDREMNDLSAELRRLDARIAKGGKGRDAALDARDAAADRLARLQEIHDRAKEEFRAIHFPALFLAEGLPGEPTAGGMFR
jgi:hypothetical protein